TADHVLTARVFRAVQEIHGPVLHHGRRIEGGVLLPPDHGVAQGRAEPGCGTGGDRKSTRLNSSHRTISYAVFCLKKKKQIMREAKSNVINILKQHRQQSQNQRFTLLCLAKLYLLFHNITLLQHVTYKQSSDLFVV